MKKIFLSCFLLSSFIFNAQVGIGTTTPTEMLEIVGSIAVGTTVIVDPLVYANNPSGFTIVGTDPASSIVNGKILAVETLYTPLTVQPYSVTNVYRDDITDLNLNIPTDNFFITIANFEAIPSVNNAGINAPTSNRGHFQIEVFPVNNLWHVRIGYPTLNTASTADRYTYNFDIILYSTRFYKNLGTVTFNLGGTNSGTAPAAPAGI